MLHIKKPLQKLTTETTSSPAPQNSPSWHQNSSSLTGPGKFCSSRRDHKFFAILACAGLGVVSAWCWTQNYIFETQLRCSQAHFLPLDKRSLPLVESCRKGMTVPVTYVPAGALLWLGSGQQCIYSFLFSSSGRLRIICRSSSHEQPQQFHTKSPLYRVFEHQIPSFREPVSSHSKLENHPQPPFSVNGMFKLLHKIRNEKLEHGLFCM